MIRTLHATETFAKTTNSFTAKRAILLPLSIVLFFLSLSFSSYSTTYYSRQAGNWSSLSTWSTTAYGGGAAASYPGQFNTLDVVNISGYTVTADITPAFFVTSISLLQTNNTGNDTKLNITTIGITLSTVDFSMQDNNVDNHMEVNVTNNAIFQVFSNATFTRSTANSKNRRMRLLIQNTANVNVNGNLTYTYGRASTSETAENEIQLDDNGHLTVSGVLTVTMGNTSGGNNQFDIEMNGTPTINTGSVSMTDANSADGDDIIIDINGGTWTNTGTWTGLIANTATSGNSLSVYVDGATLITGTVTFTQNGGGNGDMSIFINKGSTATAAVFTVNGSLNYVHTDGDNMEIETNANCTVLITGKFATKVVTGSFGDLVVFDLNGGTITILDSLTALVLANNNYFEMRIDGATLNCKGILFDQRGTGTGDMYMYLNNSSTTNTSTVTVGGYGIIFNDNGGDNMDMVLEANSSVTVNGNVTYSNNVANGNDRDEIRLNGAAAPYPTFTINGSFTGNLNSGTSGGDYILLDINAGTFTCTGNITMNTAAAVTGTANCRTEIDGASTVFNLGGTFTLNHLGGAAGANDYIYVGVNSGSPTFTAGALVLNGQSGSLTRIQLSNAVVATINGNVTLSASAAGKVYIVLNGTSNFKIKGNFIRGPGPMRFGALASSSAAKVTYFGTANQQTIAGNSGAGTDAFTYSNVVLNNTYGVSPQLITSASEGNAIIPTNCSLTFTSGIVQSSASAMFVINDNATVNSASSTSYNDGVIRKIGNDAFTYPVGNGGYYAPVAISAPAITTDQFTAQYFFTNPHPTYDSSFHLSPVDHVSQVEYWTVDRTLGTSNVFVTLSWDTPRSGVVDDIPTLLVGHWDGAQWISEGQSTTTGTTVAGTITSAAAVTSFSPFTLVSSSLLNPLPIELLSFDADICGSDVCTNWSTATETNNNFFSLEKSMDGINFIKVADVAGAGNSTALHTYSYKDLSPFRGISYYRLKQTDFNGAYTYSSMREVSFGGLGSFVIYPNPSTGRVFAQLADGNNTINVYNELGAMIANTVTTERLVELSLPATGIYFITVQNGDKLERRKVVVYSAD